MWHVVLLWSYAVFENCTLPSSLLSTARASAPITTTTMIATTAAISRRGGPFRAGAAGAGTPHAGGGAPYGESGTPHAGGGAPYGGGGGAPYGESGTPHAGGGAPYGGGGGSPYGDAGGAPYGGGASGAWPGSFGSMGLSLLAPCRSDAIRRISSRQLRHRVVLPAGSPSSIRLEW